MPIDKKTLKKFVDASYLNKREGSNVDGYVLDPELSTKRNKVYVNPETKKVKHVIAGTDSLKDWSNNLLIPLGLHKYTNRYKNSESTQKKANEKYGKENVDLITHSQSGNIAENLAKRGLVGGENTTLNPAIMGSHNKDLKVVKSKFDPVSLFTKTNKNDTILGPSSINPLTEHSTAILGNGLTHIQSILFTRPSWTLVKAKAWLKKHGYKTDVDKKPDHYRFRQIEPEEFSSFRTKHIGDNITLIIGLKKKGGNINNMKSELREQDLLDRMAKLSHDLHVHHHTHGHKDSLLNAYALLGKGIKMNVNGEIHGSGNFSDWMNAIGERFKPLATMLSPYAKAGAKAVKDKAVKDLQDYGNEYLESDDAKHYKNMIQGVDKSKQGTNKSKQSNNYESESDEEEKPKKKGKKSTKTISDISKRTIYNAEPVDEQEDVFNTHYKPVVAQPATPNHENDHYNYPVAYPIESFSSQPSSYERSWNSRYGRGVHGDGFFDDIKGGFDQGINFVKNEGEKTGKKVAKVLVDKGIPMVASAMGSYAGGPLGGVAGKMAGKLASKEIKNKTEVGGYGLKKKGRKVSTSRKEVKGAGWDEDVLDSLIFGGKKLLSMAPKTAMNKYLIDKYTVDHQSPEDKARAKKSQRINAKAMQGSGPWEGLENSVAGNLTKLADKGTNKLVNMIGDGRRRGMKGCGPWEGLENSVAGNLTKLADKGTNKLMNMMGDGVKKKPRGKLVKGSPEMKARMAKLRAMRKGGDINGGNVFDDIKNGWNRTFNPALGRKIVSTLRSPIAKTIYKGVVDVGANALGDFTGNPVLGMVGSQLANHAIDGLGLKGKGSQAMKERMAKLRALRKPKRLNI